MDSSEIAKVVVVAVAILIVVCLIFLSPGILASYNKYHNLDQAGCFGDTHPSNIGGCWIYSMQMYENDYCTNASDPTDVRWCDLNRDNYVTIIRR